MQQNTLVAHVIQVTARRRAVLTILGGADTGRVLPLAVGASVTIGRRDTCTYSIDDPSVSGLHARIVIVGGDYVIADERSTNGTFVNSVRITEPVSLRDGDRVQLGPIVLTRFTLVDDAEEEALKRMYDAALRDALTGLFNRKHLDERLESEVAYARRHPPADLSVVMLDVDHFKQVNDTFGHLAGDAVLKNVSAVLLRTVRTEDLLARYGGEEFVVVARDCKATAARIMAERLRSKVADSSVSFEGRSLRVTISAGVASLFTCGESADKTTLLKLADKRLYEAKEGGRNRVVGPP
jgi:two-component system cell cycle response regulator